MTPRRALLLTGAILLLLAAPLRAQGGAVRGVVRADGAAPLAEATVELVGAARRAGSVTDAAGAYRIPDLPAGRRLLRASRLGYAPLEIEVMVPAGREVTVDFALRPAPVELEAVQVRAGGGGIGRDTVAASAAELGLAGARALDATPGLAELGLGEPARGLPGQEPADPTSILYVRGAASDLKLVYLDGAPVYAPFPLGGLVDAFAPGLLRSADVYLGGAPARYDGGLSYVLDLRTRGVRSDGFHSEGAVDLLSARALAEVPIGSRAGVLVTGRSVHGEGSASPLPYGYEEGMLRGDLRLGEDLALGLTAFRNAEEVRLQGDTRGDSTVSWGNTALALRLRGRVGGEELEVTAAASDFAAQLPVHDSQSRIAEGDARRLRLAADLAGRAAGLRLQYGASFDRLTQRYRARGGGTVGEWTAAVGDAAGAYLDAGWQPDPRVRVDGGLRVDWFSLGSRVAAAPRLSATWLASERAALTLAVGRYHQYLRAPEDALVTASVNAEAARTLEPLAVGSSSHLALAFDQQLGDDVGLGIEGFFKSFQGMPGALSDQANSSGFDVWVRREVGAWQGWLGYSLAWVWAEPYEGNASQFAGRQLVSSGLAVPVGGRSRLDVKFAYGSGLPYSAIPLGDRSPVAAPGFGVNVSTRESPANQLSGGANAPPLLATPDRPYLRLDVGGSHTWTQRWLGRETALSSYVRLLNTLGRRDALFYRFDRDEDENPRAVAALPVVPVVGVEWKF